MIKRHILVVVAVLFASMYSGCVGVEPTEPSPDEKVASTSSALSLAPFVNLTPNVSDLRIEQHVDVNVLLVGFPDAVSSQVKAADLPAFNGVARATGDGKVFLSQRFDFDYHIATAPKWFEDAFFGLLSSVASPQPPITIFNGVPPQPVTPSQFLYDFCNLDPSYPETCSFDPSAPRVNQRFITQNYLIHAGFVEKVLSQNLGPLLGIDVTKPTVVLLNWWGRPDYVDHIYLDWDEPDPETHWARGFNTNNELAGYGATAHDDPESCPNPGDCIKHRLWFFDVSAGPMLFNGASDLVGAIPRFIAASATPGQPDYRFHHTADYAASTPGTYRPLDNLAYDLELLIGDVFVGAIAHQGDVYPPALTPPLQPHHLVLDVNRWDWEPNTSFAGVLDTATLRSKMDRLPYDVEVRVADQSDTHDSKLGHVWDCSLTTHAGTPGDSCYGQKNLGYAFGDLSSYFTDHVNQYTSGAPDYEVPIFQFKVPPPLLQPMYAGVATSTSYGVSDLSKAPTTERQTFVFTSTSSSRDSLHGHGVLLGHEVGHHLGLSHPFNGYRCVNDDCSFFVPYGFGYGYFSYAARYVSGVMTYAELNNDYSQFERDNLQRWLTYEYVDQANFIAGKIAASPKAGQVATPVAQADNLTGVALAAYQVSDYETAVEQARAAHSLLVTAAKQIKIPLSSNDWSKRRRAIGEVRQDLRDLLARTSVDPKDEMDAVLKLDGVKGLEGITPASPQLPAVAAPPRSKVKLAH